MITEMNLLDVPEIRNYRRDVIEGGVEVHYEVRQPGERDWTLVMLFTPEEDASASPVSRKRSQEFIPRGY